MTMRCTFCPDPPFFKMSVLMLLLSMFSIIESSGQTDAKLIDSLDIASLESKQKHHLWLKMGTQASSQDLSVPVIVVKGQTTEPTVGIIAGIHGNELNGVEVIRQLLEKIDPALLRGTIVAIPGLNQPGIALHQREYPDGVDLNRIFPGKKLGSESQQFVSQIDTKILPHIDYLFDLHTASFGRINSFYVRADLSDDIMSKMAHAQGADIILNSSGSSSTSTASATTMTMRARAMSLGIPSITIEYGDPQVYMPFLIRRGVTGLLHSLIDFGMIPGEYKIIQDPAHCLKSYWIYTDQGGYLDVIVDINELLEKGQKIAILRDPFGTVIKEYFSPENGIVIGKSSNPIGGNGARILHIGILE